MDCRLHVQPARRLAEIVVEERVCELGLVREDSFSDGEGVERNAAIDNDTVLNAIPSGIVIADSRSGKIRTANKAAAGMIGLEKKEIVGEHFGRFFVFSFDRVETGPRFRGETLNRPDGTKLPIEAEVTPLSRNGRSLVLLNFVDSTARQDDAKELRSKNETLERMLKEHKRSTDSMKKWLHCEIAEHRQTVSALRETNKFLKSIIDSSASISIISTDPNGNILFWNRGAEMLFGYTRDEALNRLNINMIYPRDESTQRKIREIRESIYEKKREISTEMEEITKDGRRLWIKLTACPSFDAQGRVTGVLGIGEDITKRRRAEDELQKSFQKLKDTLEGTIQAMAALVETRDPYTAGHERRVARLASAIAQEMGLGEDVVEHIRVASAMHDVGKIYVPAEILSKPGKLSDVEFSLIKAHPQVGFDILKRIEFPWPVAEIVFQHHERLDGSGYPRGLKKDDITLEARVICVADVVEAMGTHRPYRAALGIDVALGEISDNAGTRYDRSAADACIRLFRDKGFTLE